MATTSVIPAFRAALVAAIRGALPGIQVERARPVHPRAECVFLLGSFPTEVAQAAMKEGRRHRYEDFETAVEFNVTAMSTPDTNEDRAFELVAAVENVLAEDPTLGGVDGLLWAIPTSMSAGSEMTGAEGTPLTVIQLVISAKGNLQ